MPFHVTLSNLSAVKWLDILGHLLIKHERIAFAHHFACTEHLASSSNEDYSTCFNKLSERKQSDQVSLSQTQYAEYTNLSFAMVQLSLAEELNDHFKALIQKRGTWLANKLKPIHVATKHSYICMFLIAMKILMQCAQNLDRRMVVALMAIWPQPDRLSFFTCLLSAYWSAYSKVVITVLQQHFGHECHGESLDTCDPNENLFKFGGRDTPGAKMFFP